MSFRERIAQWTGQVARRMVGPAAWDNYWYPRGNPYIYGYHDTQSSVSVTEDNAVTLNVAHACIRLLGNCIAMTPWSVYERMPNDAARVATGHPAQRRLAEKPNEYQTPFEFKRDVATALVARGNAYVEMTRDGQLWPIHEDYLTVDWLDRKSGRRRVYDVDSQWDGRPRVLDQEIMWHPHLMSLDGGLTGASPVHLAAEGLGLALATQIYASRFFGQGVHMSGFMSLDESVKKDVIERIEEGLKQSKTGLFNSHKPAVFGHGAKWVSTTVSPRDAAVIELMKWNVADTCRVWGVPLHLVQETEGSTSWGTGLEQFSIGFVRYTLGPLYVLLEQGASNQMIANAMRYFTAFEIEALMRGDLKSQFEAFAQAVNSNVTWMTRNEIRKKINLPRDNSPEGDAFFVALNTSPEAVRGGEPQKSNGGGEVLGDSAAPARAEL